MGFGKQKYYNKFVWGTAFITTLGNGLVNGEENEFFTIEFCNGAILCFCSRWVEEAWNIFIFFTEMGWNCGRKEFLVLQWKIGMKGSYVEKGEMKRWILLLVFALSLCSLVIHIHAVM